MSAQCIRCSLTFDVLSRRAVWGRSNPNSAWRWARSQFGKSKSRSFPHPSYRKPFHLNRFLPSTIPSRPPTKIFQTQSILATNKIKMLAVRSFAAPARRQCFQASARAWAPTSVQVSTQQTPRICEDSGRYHVLTHRFIGSPYICD
jgi:hypothetical protein